VRQTLARLDAVLRPQGHVFAGWWIALAGVGLQVLGGLLFVHSYGAYFVLLQDEFGWSKTLLAGAFALRQIENGMLGPLQGYLLDRYGPRALISVGAVVFGLGYFAFAAIDSPLDYYLSFLLLALGSNLAGFPSITVALVHWFERHRAKAIAFSQSGFALGGMLVPLIVAALESWGWRTTSIVSGLLVIAFGLPMARIVRHRPELFEETVDGIPPEAQEGEPNRIGDRSRDMSAGEALRTGAFWMVSLGHASALLVVSAVMVHLVPHLTETLDYSLTAAGSVVALLTALQLAGQLAGGYLGDRFDKRVIAAVCMVAHAAGLLLLAYADSLWMVLAFAMLHGWAWGTRGPLMVAIRADYFGARSFGTIMGFSSLIVMVGMTTGPLVAAYLADRTGSYAPGLAALALASLAGSAFFLFARPPKRKPAGMG
jgi:MFS family permease